MANIVQVCELEGSEIKKIYSFVGNESVKSSSTKSTIPTKIIKLLLYAKYF